MSQDEFPVDEYKGPPGIPPKGGTTSRNEGPLGTPKQWISVSWDDVAFGRPEVVIPTFGPTPADVIAASFEFEKLMALEGEMGILVSEAVIEWLERMLPENESEEQKAANDKFQKILDGSEKPSPWVEKAIIDIRERLVPKHPSKE